MLALYEVRAGTCPVCGGPSEECQAPDAEGAFVAPPPVRCHRSTAVAARQEEYRQAKHPQALLWRVERR